MKMTDKPKLAKAEQIISPPWQPMSTAPKDRPILGWCIHVDDFEKLPDGRTLLSLYNAHGEGLAYVDDGPHVLEWGGAFDDSTWEYPGANLPDWWFQRGSQFEAAANPVAWIDIIPPVLMSGGAE